jgi:hypothetical protein
MNARLRTFVVVAILMLPSAIVRGQQAKPPTIAKLSIQPAPSNQLAPIDNHATEEQIRIYLQLSEELNDYRQRWIAAVDKNRSIGAPYWPESFWADLKVEMQEFDLVPAYITLYQHYVSQAAMQNVIDAYKSLGPSNFPGSPACVKWTETRLGMQADADKLTLSNTQQVIQGVYAKYKPQIAAARVKYKAEHPDWVDKYDK